MNKIIAGGEPVFVSILAQELVREFEIKESNNRMMARSMKMRKHINEAARLNSIAEAYSTAILMFLRYYGKSEDRRKG